MKKSQITRILSAVIRHGTVSIIPARVSTNRSTKKHLSATIVITSGQLVGYSENFHVVSMSVGTLHFGDFLLDSSNQSTTNNFKKALNIAMQVA